MTPELLELADALEEDALGKLSEWQPYQVWFPDARRDIIAAAAAITCAAFIRASEQGAGE